MTNDLNLKTEVEIKLTKKVNDLLYPELLKFKETNDEMFKEKIPSSYEKNLINTMSLLTISSDFYRQVIFPLLEEQLIRSLNISSRDMKNHFVLLQYLFFYPYSSGDSVKNILLSIYDQSSEIKETNVEKIKIILFDKFKTLSNFQWLKNSIYEFELKFSLNNIEIFGLRLSDQDLENPAARNEKLLMKFLIPVAILKSHFDYMINYIVNFFDFYQIKIDSKIKKVIFFVHQKFYNEINNVENSCKIRLLDQYFRREYALFGNVSIFSQDKRTLTYIIRPANVVFLVDKIDYF